MSVIQLLSLAFATVTVANVCAVSIYMAMDDKPADAKPEVIAAAANESAPDAAAPATPEKHHYKPTPFSDHYAISACEDMAHARFKQKLQHLHVLDLSTRYENSEEFFIVVLYAHLGSSHSDYNAYKVYCHTDPRTYAISYFKEYPS